MPEGGYICSDCTYEVLLEQIAVFLGPDTSESAELVICQWCRDRKDRDSETGEKLAQIGISLDHLQKSVQDYAEADRIKLEMFELAREAITRVEGFADDLEKTGAMASPTMWVVNNIRAALKHT